MLSLYKGLVTSLTVTDLLYSIEQSFNAFQENRTQASWWLPGPHWRLQRQPSQRALPSIHVVVFLDSWPDATQRLRNYPERHARSGGRSSHLGSPSPLRCSLLGHELSFPQPALLLSHSLAFQVGFHAGPIACRSQAENKLPSSQSACSSC